MASTGLMNVLIRILTSANVIDVELPLNFSQAFANGVTFKQGIIQTGALVITLPAPTIFLIYVKSVVGTTTVKWQHTGGTLVAVTDLAVGDFVLTNCTGGYTALTIGAPAVTSTYDMLIGG